ncbi:MAG: hypothetical protein ACKVP5_01125 [Aestuariivirga sp.]
MSGQPHIPFETEPTPIGEQTLIPGVRPVSIYERLMVLAAQPLGPIKPQRPCDLGLFDEAARNQLDLFSAKPQT